MHLPDAVVKEISSQLLQQPDKQAGLVSLMAMCGVCQHWRDVARHLDEGILYFDSLQSCGRNKLGRPLTATEMKFRGANAHAKEVFFHSAAKLMTGHTEVVLSGEGVTDVTLMEAARAAGRKWVCIEVKVSLLEHFGGSFVCQLLCKPCLKGRRFPLRRTRPQSPTRGSPACFCSRPDSSRCA